MAQKITIEIDEAGEVKIEASGFTGRDCLAATKNIEEALGKVSERKAKPEQFATTNQTVTTKKGT